MKRNYRGFIIFLSLLFLVTTAWGGTSSPPKRGGILRTSVNIDPPHWDVQNSSSYATHFPTSFIYSRLLRVKMGEGADPYKMEIEGDLAQKWKRISPTQYLFNLRKGVKFQNKPPVNGREITSADVKYSFDRLLSSELKSPARILLEDVKAIETPDPYTVKFILSKPNPAFLKYIALNHASIVAKEVVEKFGDLKKWESAIGSGPFILDSYQPNVRYLFKRNPDYYEKGRPYLDEIEVRIIKSPEVANVSLKSKELDLGLGYPFSDIKATELMLKDHPDMKRQMYHGNNWPHLTLACDKPPFNDKRLRQAVSMSIDRKKLLQVLGGGPGWIDNILPLAVEGSIPYKQLGQPAKFFEYNPTEAKRLIGEAGLKPPVKIKLVYTPAYGPVWVNFNEVIAAQMKAAGTFEITLVPKEYGAYMGSTVLGKYEEDGFTRMVNPPVDADEILWQYFYSNSYKNSGRVKDANLDKKIDEQRVESNPSKRLKMLKDLQVYLAEQMYPVPTVMTPQFDMWFPYVRGYQRQLVPYFNAGDGFRLIWLDK